MAQMVKNLPAVEEIQVWSLGGEHPQRGEWQNPSPVFLPREVHEQSPVVYSPCSRMELDTNEQGVLTTGPPGKSLYT